MSQNRVPGNQMLRIMGKFDGAYGRFMYHCHFLEHEDMGMMRPFVVMPPEALKFDHGGAHGGRCEGPPGRPPPPPRPLARPAPGASRRRTVPADPVRPTSGADVSVLTALAT